MALKSRAPRCHSQCHSWSVRKRGCFSSSTTKASSSERVRFRRSVLGRVSAASVIVQACTSTGALSQVALWGAAALPSCKFF